MERDREERQRKRRYNVHKMHTAVKLNELMRQKSSDAQLVFVNLPGPPDADSDSYCEFFLNSKNFNVSTCLFVYLKFI